VKTTNSPLYRHFIHGLRECRKNLGVTQDELGRRLGWRQSAVSKIERHERRIDVAEFAHICRALDVPPGEMYERLYTQFAPLKPRFVRPKIRSGKGTR
jgi:transcriptional regulator with XRE-family HTH domain